MARLFNGSSDNLTASIDLSSVNKISLSFWLWWDTFSNDNDMVLEFTADAGLNAGFFLLPNRSANPGSKFQIVLNAESVIANIDRPSAAAWHHYVVIMDLSTNPDSVQVYLDGSSQTVSYFQQNNSTNNFANSTLNFMSRNATSLFGAGRLAEVAIWPGVLLSVDEIKVLAAGVCPIEVHTNVKPYHWHIYGTASPEPETFFSANATVTGTTQTSHPPATSEVNVAYNWQLQTTLSPASIANLRMWLKADAITGLNDGDAIATWSDSSGNGFDATQSSASLKPLYKTNILNGKPVVRFDGSNDALDVSGTVLSSGQSFSLFFVCRSASPTGNYRVLIQKGTTGNQKVYILCENSTAKLYRWDAFQSTYTFSADTWALIEYTHAATSDTNATETFYVNGVQKGQRTGSVPSYTSATLNIGHAANNFSWDKDIAEICLYTQAVSTADRTSLENYFNSKYGIY